VAERLHPLWQLVLYRVRVQVREPSILFWVFLFPLLTSLALGLAFRNRGESELSVAVVDGEGAVEVALRLDAVQGLRATVHPRQEALGLLRSGAVALVVAWGAQPELLSDPTLAQGRTAALWVQDALERAGGRQDLLSFRRGEVRAHGHRYIDFLIPGLLGFGLMSSSLYGLGWGVVQMRTGKLLKRLAATPMQRSHFLASFALVRLAQGALEVGFFAAFARVLFDVRVAGSLLSLFAVGLLGALSFAGLALLLASRAQNSETASGLINLASMPMLVLSGVFFSASNFPTWMQPVLQALPLTALIDALRAVMNEGASLAQLGGELAVLGAWGALPFVLALRLFRWT
jgi:ABC-2 type transport system permease protein